MYHRADFIQSDPVQFPHRYTLKQDIEVSGLLTAIMSFGNRKQILKKAEELHGLMGDSPYQYVLSRQWEGDFPPGATGSFYRMLSHADFYGYFQRLYIAYTQFESLEEALKTYPGIPMEKLCAFLEVSAKSPQKKLNMFLRWMIRHDGEVDFGLWKDIPTSALLIPLDLHTGNVSRQLGLLTRNQNDRKAVEELTARLREMDPVDPIRYDFSLFGLGAFEKYNRSNL